MSRIEPRCAGTTHDLVVAAHSIQDSGPCGVLV